MDNEIIEMKESKNIFGNWLWWRRTLMTIMWIFALFVAIYLVMAGFNRISEKAKIKSLTERLVETKFKLNDINQQIEKAKYLKVIKSILTLQPKLDREVAEQISNAIVNDCIKKGLSSYLVVCLIFVESGYNQMSTSNKGAIGLMQVHWDTWNEHEFCKDIETKEDLYQIEKNINCGTSILKKYIQEGGSVREGLNSYYGVESTKYHEKMASALYKIMF